MSENRLSFAIGLETKGFLTGLFGASTGLNQFLEVANKVGRVFGAAWSRIERNINLGASLHDLSKRTAVSVRDLFVLQRGFQLAGVSAEAVPTALYFMQKALGGISEAGVPTAKIFSQMGLSIGHLRAVGGAAGLGLILQQLGRMKDTDAAFASSRIFGRYAGPMMLQLARNAEDMATAMKASAQAADQFQRHAAAFDRLKDQIEVLRWKLSDLFVGPAGLIADIANSIPTAMKEGRLTELMELSLTVAFEAAANQLWMALQRIAAGLPSLFVAGFKSVGAAGSAGKGVGLGVAAWFVDLLHQGNVWPDITGPMALELGLGAWGAAGQAKAKVGGAIKDAVKAIAAGAGVEVSPLFGPENRALLAQVLAELEARKRAPKRRVGAEDLTATKEPKLTRAKPDVPDLERIGFLFGAGRATDYVRQTAENTRRTADALMSMKRGAPAVAFQFTS